jgi:hypothetical protein
MTESFQLADPVRFQAAVRQFDEANARDPNRELKDGSEAPRELVYAQWLSDWVLRLKPDASEALRLAARAAHLCRWEIPRTEYPQTRTGYLQWRQSLKQFHAGKAAGILTGLGYAPELVSRVQALISKSAFPVEPESRVLEDALCLVFLQHQFADLARKSSDDKMINALRKSWKKMTPAAREIALSLPFEPREMALIERALAKPDG